jgi:hypothetical protein
MKWSNGRHAWISPTPAPWCSPHWKVGVAFDIRKMLEAGKASIHRGAQITTEIAMRQCILWEAF